MAYFFTSESVTQGHPDKICDQISDAVLDAILAQDKHGRVACESCCTTGMTLVMGEITTSCYVDIPKLVRQVVCDIGYDDADIGFDGKTCAVLTAIDEQSPDIDMGVSKSFEIKGGDQDSYNQNGAGDQGMMFGFACDETPELMPMPISLARKLTNRLTEVRKQNILPFLCPDGKSQVTVEYDENNRPVRLDTIVVSSQHRADVDIETVRAGIIEHVIRAVIPADMMDVNTTIYVNPTGRFVVGGPHGDSGLTGRKIIADTYGGYARHGGGAFSGKDPTKVDRSAAYAARYVTKNIVAAGLAKKCELELSYAIGVAKPVSVSIETFGTETVPKDVILDAVNSLFDLRPAAIIDAFDMRRPIYRDLAANGHIGRTDADLPWERTDKAEALRELANR
ncbi:MAG: methionine adenosyltransferase [Oscillospiraceae bacterium]|nr:methionine adenosyltransferase [Oscillospiraceae bacterium]